MLPVAWLDGLGGFAAFQPLYASLSSGAAGL